MIKWFAMSLFWFLELIILHLSLPKLPSPLVPIMIILILVCLLLGLFSKPRYKKVLADLNLAIDNMDSDKNPNLSLALYIVHSIIEQRVNGDKYPQSLIIDDFSSEVRLEIDFVLRAFDCEELTWQW